MREHDGANVPVLKMTVPCQEEAGVLNVWNVVVVVFSANGESHLSHHRAARKQCTMAIASVVSQAPVGFLPFIQKYNSLPCTKVNSRIVKIRKIKTETRTVL